MKDLLKVIQTGQAITISLLYLSLGCVAVESCRIPEDHPGQRPWKPYRGGAKTAD